MKYPASTLVQEYSTLIPENAERASCALLPWLFSIIMHIGFHSFVFFQHRQLLWLRVEGSS